ncbi:MAG: di-trans,poly-cis-decaprenylcistransferase [Candidatus Aenigmarchaeota archaeon]|nr:di-trans,poly-cis-decaprenylcistransferase [Candidatus Aenigmarchaeota archaeon]
MRTKKSVPKHVAVILDGNRRWATNRKMKPWEGHRVGADRFDDFVGWCKDAGIKQISAYVLSSENLKRSRTEIRELMRIFMDKLVEWDKSEKLKKYQIRLNFLGNLVGFPSDAVKMMAKLMKKTAKFGKMIVNILVGYSGKYELINAFNSIMKSMSGGIKITESAINRSLLVKTPVDLVIRTGGHSRLSNFLLWQSAYAEMYTTNVLWPDFTKREFNKSISFFSNTQRNFGV